MNLSKGTVGLVALACLFLFFLIKFILHEIKDSYLEIVQFRQKDRFKDVKISFTGNANEDIFELVGSVDEMLFKDDDEKFEMAARTLS